MTFELLKNLLSQHNIPENVHLQSDSGWECYETEMDGLYYNKKENILMFTQKISEYDKYYNNKDWQSINFDE